MKKAKKAFTLVELVIVIAVIAVLAAVLIPTFSSVIKNAKISADTQLVKNLNTALTTQYVETTPNTMYEAVQAVKDSGYDVVKLTPTTAGYNIVWDKDSNRFALFNDKNEVEYKDSATTVSANELYKLWTVVQENSTPAENNQFSLFYAGTSRTGTINVSGIGVDLGDNVGMTEVNYTGDLTASKDIVIRTTGDSCTLNITAPNDDIKFYGFAKEIDAIKVKSSSLHIYGAINALKVTEGHVVVESTGVVFDVQANTGSINNNGYVAKVTSGNAVSGKAVGGNYEINSLTDLENFRDIVNAGANDFSGITVKLTADITLEDGWTPIGKGGRKGTNTVPFSGTFDGNHKTISNLNNKGYDPASSVYTDIYTAGTKTAYAYGLFGLVKNATITDLTLNNVDIDSSRVNMVGDSVAALVGYGINDITIKNVTVRGTIKAVDAVAGIIGRAYDIETTTGTTHTLTVENCANYATITVIGNDDGSKAAGIIGYANNDKAASNSGYIVNIKNNSNNGTINGYAYTAGVAVYCGGNTTYNVSGNINNGNIYVPTAKKDVAYTTLKYGNSTEVNYVSGNTNTGKCYINNVEQTTGIVISTNQD